MSNTVSDVTGLTYGGVDLQAVNLSIHFWIEQGLTNRLRFVVQIASCRR